MLKEHQITLEERVADLKTELSSKSIDLEEVIARLKKAEKDDPEFQWFLGLREGQLATFEFILNRLNGNTLA